MTATLRHGDCLDIMPTIEPASVDAIVTDPPYGLGFMGKDWDHGVPGAHFWEAAIRVAKPGAHLLAFGGTRTYHRLACAIEDAGWEIRDCLMWLYGTGFPKSRNGPWGGTALKPAWEPIIMARKPLMGTVAANVVAHGTGAINVDRCRLGDGADRSPGGRQGSMPQPMSWGEQTGRNRPSGGRWPANVCLDPEASMMLGAPARFLYCAKASRAEREEGLEGRERKAKNWSSGDQSPGTFQSEGTDRTSTNHHPTVKPVALMRWLCRLVTPPGGLVLDPFAGSGSTGVAAALEGMCFLGIEIEADYKAIAEARIANAARQPSLWGR